MTSVRQSHENQQGTGTLADHSANMMPSYQHFDITKFGDVTVVHFCNRRITEDLDIQEFGNEMSNMVEKEKPQKLLLNFSTVEFLGSSALGKLINLERKVRSQGGAIKLSNIRASIYEVLVIVKLNRLFDIKEDEASALAAFSSTWPNSQVCSEPSLW